MIAVILCWRAVEWSFAPGQYLWLDEIGNLTRHLHGVDLNQVTWLPQIFYNDRPVGFVLARWLYSIHGFGYSAQVPWFLMFHAANLALGWMLLRRSKISTTLSFAAIAFFGMLSTTVQTATYLGAIFDVVCLTLLLSSCMLLQTRSTVWMVLSALCFFLALRTKEIAIVAPALFVLLAIGRWPTRQSLRNLSRLWPQALVFTVLLAQYVRLYGRAELTPSSAYTPQLKLSVLSDSFLYYTRLMFALEDRSMPHWGALCVLVAAALIATAILRRNLVLMTGLAGFVLTLLPVAALPSQRSPFYLYVPQFFLILGLAALVEELITMVPQRAQVGSRIAIALAIFAWCAHFRSSSYFNDRVNFSHDVRLISARSGAYASQLSRHTGPTEIVVESGKEQPWLFLAGPCFYFQVVWENPNVTCSFNPDGVVVKAADRDRIHVKYQPDGSFQFSENR